MKRRVVYNGVEMVEGWPERIQEAQQILESSIGGVVYPRVRYGCETDDWGADRVPCHDCKVIKGQLHVPSCDGEQCPACGGQAIGCDCERGNAHGKVRKRARHVRPFSSLEQAVVEARRLFIWRHIGFAPDGDAIFEVDNTSTIRLPVLTIGVRGPNLRGAARLNVSGIAPGSRSVLEHDCYRDLVKPTEVEFLQLDDPTPETRESFWEFKRLPKGP